MAIAIYTAITGGIDELRAPWFLGPGIDHICFTDDPALTSAAWQVRPVPPVEPRSARRIARELKLLPHRFLPEYETTIWLDATFSPAADFTAVAATFLARHDLATFAHPWRDCIYDEADECILVRKDAADLIRSQMARYRLEGHPAHAGLVASGCMLRRKTSSVVSLCEAWWSELRRHSVRDKLSFNYVARRASFEYAVIPGQYYDNPYYRYSPHTKADVQPPTTC